MSSTPALDPPVALLVVHRVRPGRRDDVRTIWHRLMAPAVAANDGHLHYHYCLDADEADAVVAFQVHRSRRDAEAFLETEAHAAYEAQVAPLLVSPPDVRRLVPDWSKAGGA